MTLRFLPAKQFPSDQMYRFLDGQNRLHILLNGIVDIDNALFYCARDGSMSVVFYVEDLSLISTARRYMTLEGAVA